MWIVKENFLRAIHNQHEVFSRVIQITFDIFVTIYSSERTMTAFIVKTCGEMNVQNNSNCTLIWCRFLSFTNLSVICPLFNKNAENCLHHDENWRKELLPPPPTGCHWWAGGHWGWEGRGRGGWGKVGGLETSIGGQHAQPPCSHHGLLVEGCQLWCSYLFWNSKWLTRI